MRLFTVSLLPEKIGDGITKGMHFEKGFLTIFDKNGYPSVFSVMHSENTTGTVVDGRYRPPSQALIEGQGPICEDHVLIALAFDGHIDFHENSARSGCVHHVKNQVLNHYVLKMIRLPKDKQIGFFVNHRQERRVKYLLYYDQDNECVCLDQGSHVGNGSRIRTRQGLRKTISSILPDCLAWIGR